METGQVCNEVDNPVNEISYTRVYCHVRWTFTQVSSKLQLDLRHCNLITVLTNATMCSYNFNNQHKIILSQSSLSLENIRINIITPILMILLSFRK